MLCPTCATPADLAANFCAQCGTVLRASRLPVKRQPDLPAPVGGGANGLVQQALVLAAGALLPVVARGLLRLALRAMPVARLPLVYRNGQAKLPASDEVPLFIVEMHAVTETRIVRRIRVQR